MEVAASSSSQAAATAAAAAAAAAAKKEWRAVSEHSLRTNGTEDAEHGKLGQSDERTIYEEGMEPLGVEYCSITINGGGNVSDDALQQRLHGVARQREALQQMEIELRAQAIARSEIMDVQNSLETQLKEHSISTAKLKDQLGEREKHIRDLRMKLDDKDRELHALKIDSETAWAKEDLLREQKKELATFRRERDNAEAERGQHLKQIHDLQEHIREKESQFVALEEQHRVAQETILFKDEQLREAQAWISRVQEMDVLQSSTIQAELRERTEQFSQYWMALQRQYVIMERHHMQTIQQLQVELSEARKTNGAHTDSGQLTNENTTDSSSYIQNNGNQINVNDVKSHGNLAFTSNGTVDTASLYASASNQAAKTEHAHGVPTVPSSVIGMGTFLPGQMTALNPYVMNPQGIQQSFDANSPVPQSLLGHFQPLSTNPGQNQWQGQQTTMEIPQVNQSTYQSPQSEKELLRADPRYGFGISSETQMVHHPNSHTSQQSRSSSAGLSGEVQVFESTGPKHSVSSEQQRTLTMNSLHSALEFSPAEQKNELKGENILVSTNQSHEQVLTSGQQWSTPDVIMSSSNQTVKSTGSVEGVVNDVKFPEVTVTTAQVPKTLIAGKSMDPNLLDERSLLACIVRAIPTGSDKKIRISTTLPNRLAKMLAPLHWHDYKKHYGKLDDFVACHPELFVIEGDFIHLREGAQEIISATTAAAKVAAAAAATSAPYSSLLPSVAVTPVAQINRQKRPQLVESRAANSISLTEGISVTSSRDSCDIPQISKRRDQQQNGASFNIIQGVADVAISDKQKNNQEINALSSVTRPGNPSMHLAVGDAAILNNTSLSSSRIKELSNGRHYFGGKKQASSSGAGLISRR